MTKERQDLKEANSNKLRLVLNNQKRLENQLDAAKLDNEALAASKAKVEAEKVELTAKMAEIQQKVDELETSMTEAAEALPPWETDEELRSMRPMDIRACFQYEEEPSLSVKHQVRKVFDLRHHL